MKLSDIEWPVFRLGEVQPSVIDNQIVYLKEYFLPDTAESTYRIRVVDDKDVPGNTLGMRRLILKHSKAPLFPIRTALYFLPDLIKMAKKHTWFIDNSGKLFQYRKSQYCRLEFHKITKIIPLAGGFGCLVQVEGLAQRFKCMFPPNASQKYAGILRWGLGYLFYGLYKEKHTPTRRQV